MKYYFFYAEESGWDEIELVATENVVEQGTEFSQGLLHHSYICDILVKMKLLKEKPGLDYV